MKNTVLLKIIYGITLLVVVVNSVFMMKNYLFSNINELPEGKLKYTCPSPESTKKINVYFVENTLGNAVRCELVTPSGKQKTVFWQTDLHVANVVWQDEDNFTVNGIPIFADGKTVYDCRRGKSLFRDGALVEDILQENGKE